MKSKNKRIIIMLSVLLAAVIGGAAWLFTLSGSKQEVVVSESEVTEYPFKEAAIGAATIVHGKVLEKSESSRFIEITVEVIEAVKGAENAEKIICLEAREENGKTGFKNRDSGLAEVGKEYMFFVDEQGVVLNSQTVVPVKDGKVALNGYLEPRCFFDPETDVEEGIPVDTYIGVINHVILKWKEEMGTAIVDWIPDPLSGYNQISTEVFYGKVLDVSQSALAAGVISNKVQIEILEYLKGSEDTQRDASWFEKFLNVFNDGTSLYREIEMNYINDYMEKGAEAVFWMCEDEVAMWVPLTSGFIFTSGYPKEYSNSTINEPLIFTKEQYLEVLRKALE